MDYLGHQSLDVREASPYIPVLERPKRLSCGDVIQSPTSLKFWALGPLYLEQAALIALHRLAAPGIE